MKISDLAFLVKGVIEGDGTVEILGLSGIDSARRDDLTFALDENRLAQAEGSRTACILTTPIIRKSTKPLIRVDNPKLAFLILYRALYPSKSGMSSIHASAAVADSVSLGENVQIGPQVSIEANVTIGDNTVIESGCVIKKNSSIGASCHLHPRVVLYDCSILKDKVVLHAGVVVGSDGFGYVKDKGAIYKFPQLGKVIIEENVEIGANTCIDRGSLDDTIIGANTKMDNLCHIAHNVKIGRNVLMAAQCGIAGSTVIGDNVTMSGQIAVIDNVKIGNNAVIGGKSGIIGNIEENAVMWGSPARPLAMAKKQMAVLYWLTKNYYSISELVKKNKLKKNEGN